jgi:nucleotide-binding universal stress UspA family protein
MLHAARSASWYCERSPDQESAVSILIALDLSAPSEDAIAIGRALAQARGESVVLAHVVEHLDGDGWRILYEDPETLEEQVRAACTRALTTLAEPLLEGVDYFIDVVAGSPAEQIELAIDRHSASMVVVGATALSEMRAVLGSTVSAVVRHASVPVLMAPSAHEEATFERVLVAVELVDESVAVLRAAAGIARLFGGKVDVLNAVELPRFSTLYEIPASYLVGAEDQVSEERRKKVSALVARAGAEDVLGAIHVEMLSVIDALEFVATKTNPGLVVTGTHARSGLNRVFLGSTAERVLRSSKHPVMTVPLSHET